MSTLATAAAGSGDPASPFAGATSAARPASRSRREPPAPSSRTMSGTSPT